MQNHNLTGLMTNLFTSRHRIKHLLVVQISQYHLGGSEETLTAQKQQLFQDIYTAVNK